MTYKPTRKELLELIESIEANAGDATVLRRELQALEPRPDTPRRGPPRRRTDWRREEEKEEETLKEYLARKVGDLFPDGITDELVAKLIEIDGSHSLKELRAMCQEAGLSTSGDKKVLAAKLVAAHWQKYSLAGNKRR